MAVTREELLNDPMSGARPLSGAEATERARNAELAAQWLPATSPAGSRHQVNVTDAAVLEDMRRAGWLVREPDAQDGQTLMRDGRPDRDRHHDHRHEHAQPGHSAHRHVGGGGLGGLLAAGPGLDLQPGHHRNDANVPIEKISRLFGFDDTTTTETVYRFQIR